MHIRNTKLNFSARIHAKRLFLRLYSQSKINSSASKSSLSDQLGLYLNHFSAHIKKSVEKPEMDRILKIIERNNKVALVLNSAEFKRIVSQKKDLAGKVVVGFVFCIDGRIPSIFLGDRFAKFWEVPAGEIVTVKRKSDGKLIPSSTDLGESLRRRVTSGMEVLEIVFAHTSLLDLHHGCGAMAAKRKNNELENNLTNEEANLKILETKTIPAITNLYNDFREQKGFEPLKQVGISALYDTDSFGIILNYDKRAKGESLSTTVLTNSYKDLISEKFVKENLVFASYKEKFHDLKYTTVFFQNLLKITKKLLTDLEFTSIQETFSNYITKYYPDLTKNQMSTLKFILTRTIALQYLTGLSSVSERNLYHPFVKHEETYMAVSIRGAAIGKYDPEDQGFSSTPADSKTAVKNIKTKISIMIGSKENRERPFILFICNLLDEKDLEENNRVLQRAMATNAELLRDICLDPELGEMVRKTKIIPVPVMIAEDTGEVLKIADHSAYI